MDNVLDPGSAWENRLAKEHGDGSRYVCDLWTAMTCLRRLDRAYRAVLGPFGSVANRSESIVFCLCG